MTEVTYRSNPRGEVLPYAASATAGGIVWLCGQIPTHEDGSVPESMHDQVTAALANLERALVAAQSSLRHIVKLTVFLADLGEFDDYNSAYCDYFGAVALPPRTTVEVARFRGEKRIEIDAVAVVA
ncbi:RidA family protein [Brevibacterium casei]|uniref:Reactive intermediate deaminase TdcF n=3 Tax=Brevibacterium TaxID=1696 RepID=A0A165EHH3_9MICO|nr:RidA family protein [Brevibacterium casei]KZE23466.1 hypothetical protein AVW13_04470 [Brevibacterium casei]MBE4693472.1 RidA family protein [Brevibacterium casei]MBY3576595.1 RidA family protein [Brevibacterium casei]MCT2181509.1 RidA family protein [Brevibacterium casei]MDH5147686.1 RidA family protein [Brevibacterium casei]